MDRRRDVQLRFQEFESRGGKLKVLRHATLPAPIHKLLLRTIDDHIGDGHRWEMTIQALADEMCCSYQTAWRAIRELVELNLIWCDRIGKHASDGRREFGICWANLIDGCESQKQKPVFDPRNVEIPSSLNTSSFRKSWCEWCDSCENNDRKITRKSAEKQIEILAKHGPQSAIDAINKAIANGWAGLHPETRTNKTSVARVHLPEGAAIYDTEATYL